MHTIKFCLFVIVLVITQKTCSGGSGSCKPCLDMWNQCLASQCYPEVCKICLSMNTPCEARCSPESKQACEHLCDGTRQECLAYCDLEAPMV